MSDETPLYIRVAEALGIDTDESNHERDETSDGLSACVRCGAVEGWTMALPPVCALRYDTDWSATGPLIEQYRISVGPEREGLWAADCWDEASKWVEDKAPVAYGPAPLIAVCNLILALKEEGKL